MRFSIENYEKVFPRKQQASRVIIEKAEEKIDSVIEGSSEDDAGPATEQADPDIKIYQKEQAGVMEGVPAADQGGDQQDGNE